MNIKITLTDEQRQQLQPLFDHVKKVNADGGVAAIAAQVWEDGAVACVFVNREAYALARALGGRLNKFLGSAASKMGEDEA
jgi:citrate lyase gamma subunit